MFDIFSFVFFFVVTTREGASPSRKIIDNNFVYEQEVRARVNKQGMCKVSFSEIKEAAIKHRKPGANKLWKNMLSNMEAKAKLFLGVWRGRWEAGNLQIMGCEVVGEV